MTNDSLKLKGLVRYQIFDKCWFCKEDSTEENIVTITWKGMVTNLMGNVSSPAAFTYLANGSSSTAAVNSQTALIAENTLNGSARASATVTQQTTTTTNDTLQLVYSWSITGNVTVNEVGVFNANPAWTMLCRQVTSSTKNLVNGDTFTVTYSIILS